jgi:antitoxin component YwqK of YwqJK toxin-antitoxin module
MMEANNQILPVGVSITVIDETTTYYLDGKIHRDDDDKPAVFNSYFKKWYKHGLLHREVKPAIKEKNGVQIWYQNGLMNRLGVNPTYQIDRNARWCVRFNSNIKDQDVHYEPNPEYFQRGDETYHIVDGVIRVFYEKYTRMWFKDGVLHRDNNSPAYIDSSNSVLWMIDGLLHRDDDLPAIIMSDGTKIWYQKGQIHRGDDKPAIVKANETQVWYQNGVMYREKGSVIIREVEKELIGDTSQLNSVNDEPALTLKNGTKMWYKNGELHRDNGEPAIVKLNGTRKYYVEGLLHRDNDLPALIKHENTRKYYQHGKIWRSDGFPAILWGYGLTKISAEGDPTEVYR